MASSPISKSQSQSKVHLRHYSARDSAATNINTNNAIATDNDSTELEDHGLEMNPMQDLTLANYQIMNTIANNHHNSNGSSNTNTIAHSNTVESITAAGTGPAAAGSNSQLTFTALSNRLAYKRQSILKSATSSNDLNSNIDSQESPITVITNNTNNTNSTAAIEGEFHHRHHSTADYSHVTDKLVRDDLTNKSLVFFQWDIFIEEFLIHIFSPLAIPYIIYRYSWISVLNRQLASINPNNIIWCMFWSSLVLWSIFPMPTVSFSELFLSIFLVLSRNGIIAAKYAYYSPAQNRERHQRLLTSEEINNSLVLGGWRMPNTTLMNNELQHAVDRLRVDYSQLYLTFSSSLEGCAYMRHLSEVSSEPSDQQYYTELQSTGRLHAKLLLKSMIADSVQSNNPNKWLFPVAITAAILHVLIPFAYRAGIHPNSKYSIFGDTGIECIVIIFCLLMSLLNFVANLGYVLVGIVDYNRRIFLMHQCSALLTSTYRIWQTRLARSLPLLDYFSSRTIASWLIVRSIFKDYGLQYFLRVQGYASIWLAFMLLYVLFLLYQVFFKRTTEYTAITYAIYDLTVFFITFLLLILSAKKLNEIHIEHRKILIHKKNSIQKILSLYTNDSREFQLELIKSKEMIESAIEVIEIEDLTSPVKILGFDANQNFFSAMIGVAGSGAAAAIKLFTEQNK